MEKPRPISSGEAMRWNEDVERRRKEYHAQRCAENPIYRRVCERMKAQQAESMQQIADVMNAERRLRVSSVMENAEAQPIKTHEEVLRELAIMECVGNPKVGMAQGAGFGFGMAFAAMLLADGDALKQRMKEFEEERPYMDEIRRANESFDKELVCLSGFEW